MPLLLAFSFYGQTLANTYGDPTLFGYSVIGVLTPFTVALSFLVPDVTLTVFAAIVSATAHLLLLAPLFPIMRFVEA